ncbi:MAG TPA: hypothetical protein PLU61_12125, partial [Rhodoglobus sp.]|nr:hypothetical protein [Rhodoglobus sp.]
MDRCRELGFEFRGDVERLQSNAGLSRAERALLSSDGLLQPGDFRSASHIITVAQDNSWTIGQSLTAAIRLGLVTKPVQTALAALGDHHPDDLDVRLSKCFNYPSLGYGHAHDDSVARARLHIWELSEKDLMARIERLRPALEQIMADVMNPLVAV